MTDSPEAPRLVVLADLDESWRPSEDVFRLGDSESRLRFPVCKLVEKVHRQLGENDPSPAVQIARAQIAALRTVGDGEGRYRAKWQLVRNLYNLGARDIPPDRLDGRIAGESTEQR